MIEFQVKLLTNNAEDEAVALHQYIKEHNLKKTMVKMVEKPTTRGSMDVSNYLPIMEIILGSGGIAGVWGILKAYFDNRSKERIAKIEQQTTLETAKINKEKELTLADKQKEIAKMQEETKRSMVKFTLEKDGQKLSMEASTFNELEFEQFKQLLEHPTNTENDDNT